MFNTDVRNLVEYGISSGLLPECERVYAINQILNIFNEYNYEEPQDKYSDIGLDNILKNLIDEAINRGIIGGTSTERDIFDTKLMNCLMPRPSQIQKIFWDFYKDSPKCATDYFYKLSQDSDYIRRYRISKDKKWKYDCEYGKMDITINLAKPEKDPKAIAAAKNSKSSSYPKCALCIENEGYSGHLNHPARDNHRIIPLNIDGKKWGFQYSPYVYYNEHCILLNGEHTPMQINRETFIKLFDFIKQFPHYFIGSNADLPIVGGSILSHDHFQGGNYTFAMEEAVIEKDIIINGFDDIKAGILKWPLSVIRISSEYEKRLIDAAEHILNKWRSYTDEEAFIFAKTNGENHNTITPIARKRDNIFELDLVLRNNITTDEYPLGVYHPHSEYHNIKKENIGLIEVMGLAVLPSRLKEEIELIKEYILENKDISSCEKIEKHANWVKSFIDNYDNNYIKENIDEIIQNEIGKTFVNVLKDAGVYKCDENGRKAFVRFIESI